MKLASNGALFVVAADKLHNVNSMVDDFIAIGEKLWQRFNAPSRPQDILWYYSEMHVALGDRLGNIRIVERLGEGIDRLNLLANQKVVVGGALRHVVSAVANEERVLGTLPSTIRIVG